jgi:hypothetical protein
MKPLQKRPRCGPSNRLPGQLGDRINALAMAIGFNLRKILRRIFLSLPVRWLIRSFDYH